MLGRWLKKWNDNFTRKMITMCVSTVSTRDLTAMSAIQFAGISASELAKAVNKEASIPLDTPNARLVCAVFTTVYSNHFSSLLGLKGEEPLDFALPNIFAHAYYTEEFPNFLEVMAQLNDSELIIAIQMGCKIWLKDPSLYNLKKLAEGFRLTYNSISHHTIKFTP